MLSLIIKWLCVCVCACVVRKRIGGKGRKETCVDKDFSVLLDSCVISSIPHNSLVRVVGILFTDGKRSFREVIHI